MLPSNSIFLMLFTTARGKPRAASRSGAVCRGEEGRSQRRCDPARNALREGGPSRAPANLGVSADAAGKTGGRGGGAWRVASWQCWPRRSRPSARGAGVPAAASALGRSAPSRVRVRLPLLGGTLQVRLSHGVFSAKSSTAVRKRRCVCSRAPLSSSQTVSGRADLSVVLPTFVTAH